MGWRDLPSWDLVRAAQQGDVEAFAQLYRRYERYVHGYVLGRTNAPVVAQDLTSETFVRILCKIGTVRERAVDVRAWITTIARNMVLDHQRSARIRREVLIDQLTEDRPSHQDNVEETALLHDLRAEIGAAVAQLSPAQRECIFLRFYRGFSVEQTAARMGSNAGAVRSMQLRALRRLAATLSTGSVLDWVPSLRRTA